MVGRPVLGKVFRQTFIISHGPFLCLLLLTGKEQLLGLIPLDKHIIFLQAAHPGSSHAWC